MLRARRVLAAGRPQGAGPASKVLIRVKPYSGRWRGSPVEMKNQPLSAVPPGTAPPLPIEITADTLKEASSRYPLLVIDCWAPWCVPCKALTPIVEQLHEAYKGKITFGTLNTDDQQELAMEFGIMGIPTLLVIKDGQHVDSIVGVKPKGELERRLKEYL